MEYSRLLLYIGFGVLPSVIWLLYYLTKDLHPEPKKMIVKVFIWGAIATLPVLVVQLLLSDGLLYLANHFLPTSMGYLPFLVLLLKWFFVIAFTEELFKYLVVRFAIYNNKALDEPLDIMLYMVVAALGFAALENIFYLFSPVNGVASFNQAFQVAVTISFIRFVGATLLHTLCSALMGYFVVKSIYNPHKKIRFIIIGLLSSTLLHALYNFSIISIKEPFNFVVSLTIIGILSLFIMYDFDEVQKWKGICKL